MTGSEENGGWTAEDRGSVEAVLEEGGMGAEEDGMGAAVEDGMGAEEGGMGAEEVVVRIIPFSLTGGLAGLAPLVRVW